MPSTVLDSDIFKDMFGSAEMRAVFSDDNLLKCCVDAEVALAVAQGRLGVIPQEAADAIARLAPSVAIDRAELKHVAENVGYPILGLVRQLSQKLGEAGRYVHWGATTQDIVDTATVLQIRAALAIIERDIAAVSAALAKLAEKHRDTADARPHASATGAADHLRLQMRDLALHDGPPCRAPARAEAARAGRAVRRRGRHARLARRQGASRCGANTRASSSSAIRRSPGMWRATRLPRRSTSSRS